jgi:hypothetical protein
MVERFQFLFVLILNEDSQCYVIYYMIQRKVVVFSVSENR